MLAAADPTTGFARAGHSAVASAEEPPMTHSEQTDQPRIAFGDTSSTVWLGMHHHPVPTVAPQRLAAVTTALRDPSGTITDWQYAAQPAGAPSDRFEDFGAYQRWRGTWTQDRAIASHDAIETFLHWADHRINVGALHVLRLSEAHINAEKVRLMRGQSQKAIEHCQASPERGVGLLNAGTGQLVRGYLAASQPATLSENDAGSLQLIGQDVQLRRTTSREDISLLGWALDNNDTADLHTTSGPATISSSELVELLRHTSPTASRVSIGQIPILRLFASLLGSLADITDLATTAHADLYLRTRPT
jgi:hypothetical protein